MKSAAEMNDANRSAYGFDPIDRTPIDWERANRLYAERVASGEYKPLAWAAKYDDTGD